MTQNEDGDTIHNETDEQRETIEEVPQQKRKVVKRQSSTPPEVQEASRQMKSAFSTLNTILNNKKNETEDECDLFGKLLAKKLKKFSEIERQELMYEIDTMMINKLRYSERATSSLSTHSAHSNFSSSSSTTLQSHHPSFQKLYTVPFFPGNQTSNQSSSVVNQSCEDQNNFHVLLPRTKQTTGVNTIILLITKQN